MLNNIAKSQAKPLASDVETIAALAAARRPVALSLLFNDSLAVINRSPRPNEDLGPSDCYTRGMSIDGKS